MSRRTSGARQSSASQSNKIFCRPDTSVLCRRDDVGHFCGDLSNLLSRRVVGRAISCLRWQQCSQTQIPGDFTPQITITLSTDNFVRQTLFGKKCNTLNEQHCSSEHCKHTSKEPMISHVTFQRCLWVWDQQISLLGSAMPLVKSNFRGDRSARWQFAGRGSYLSLMQ